MQMKKHARDHKKLKKEKERSSVITKHKLKMFSDNSSTRKKIINQNSLPNPPFIDPSHSGSGHNFTNQQQYRSQAPRLYQPAPQYRISRESFSVKKQYEQNSPGVPPPGIPPPVPNNNIPNVVLKNNHMPRHSRTYKLKRADRYINETEHYQVQIENAPSSSKRGSKPGLKRGDLNPYKSGISSSPGASKSSPYKNNPSQNYSGSRPIQGLEEEDYENFGWKRERYESQLSQETTELAEKNRRIPFSSNSIPTNDPRYESNSRKTMNSNSGNNNNNNNTAHSIGRPQSPTTFGRGNFTDTHKNTTHNTSSLHPGTTSQEQQQPPITYPTSYNPGNYLNAPLPYSPSPLDLQQHHDPTENSGFSVSQQPPPPQPPPHFGFSSHHQPPPPPPLPQNTQNPSPYHQNISVANTHRFPIIDPYNNHQDNSNSHSQNYYNNRNPPPYSYTTNQNQNSQQQPPSSRRGGNQQESHRSNNNTFHASSASSRQPYNRFVYNVEIENELDSKEFIEKYETSKKNRHYHHNHHRHHEDKLDVLDSPTAGISSRSHKHSFYSESDERLMQLNEILRHSNRHDSNGYNDYNYYSERPGPGKYDLNDQHCQRQHHHYSSINDNDDSDTASYPELVDNMGVGISNISNTNNNTKFPYDIVNAGHYDYSKDLEKEQRTETTQQDNNNNNNNNNNVARIQNEKLNTHHTTDEKSQLLEKLNEVAFLQQQQQKQQQQNMITTYTENKEEEKKEIDSFGDRKMDSKNDTVKESNKNDNNTNSSTIRKKKNPYNLISKKRHDYEQCLMTTTVLLDKTIVHPVQALPSYNENNNKRNDNNSISTTKNKHNEVENNSIVIRKHKYKKGKENHNNNNNNNNGSNSNNNNNTHNDNDERRPSPLPEQFKHFDYSKTKSSTNNNSSTTTYKIKPSTRYLNM